MLKKHQKKIIIALYFTVCLVGCRNSFVEQRVDVAADKVTNEKYEIFGDKQKGIWKTKVEGNRAEISREKNGEKVTEIFEKILGQEIIQKVLENAAEEPEESEFVKVVDYIPDIVIDLKYASKDNFTGQVIYSFTDAYLRYGTVKKLQKVQHVLQERGMILKVWDGFRPVSAQFTLWEVCPNPIYVADPNHGYSSHSRGGTVDITLVFVDGTEVEMPTDFDDFSIRADRDYSDCSMNAAENASFLEKVMCQCGFSPYFGEWWHYSDVVEYPVEEVFEP